MTLPLPTPSAPRVRWLNLTAGSLPYFLTQNLPPKTLKIVFTPDAESALRLQTAWQFFRPADNALFLPDWETLPYERFSPHQDLVSERLSVLWQLKNGLADALFVPVATAMQRLAPAPFLLGRTFWLKTGQRLDIAALRQNLVEAGYSAVSNVVAGGEFAVRGGIVDLFPTGSDTPYRIDLFDDEIDSIKTFDPDSQRTIAPVSEIRLLPAHEFPTDDAAQKIFRSRFREEVNGNPNDAAVYKAVSGGQFGAGVEYYLPLFFEDGCATLFDYLGADALAVCVGDVHTEARRFEAEVKSRFQMAQGDATYPPLPPQHLYLAADQFSGCLKGYPQILPELGGAAFALPNVAVNRQAEQPLQALQDFQTAFDGRILLTAESAGRRETMLGFFAQHGLKPKSVDGWQAFLESCEKLCITVTPLAYGFRLGQPENGVDNVGWVATQHSAETENVGSRPNLPADTPSENLALITESDLYQYVAKSRSSTRRKKHAAVSDGLLRDLAEISIGDPVVHEEHGIGRYMGLVTMDLGGEAQEMMLLEYAGEAQLYVPVSQLHLISRYDGFGYEETEDQAAAIAAVIKDLTQARPMDRLVCGDVGFGKTEVALRAAFVAVMGGKQVAVLAPTTLLVEQHAQNFADRFADFPVKVAQLSRFNSSKETRATLAGMADGTVDIVIGTHKLVQDDIAFKNLGLVIIDEEHRFGVHQKEQLKKLRANVDILTLTATPIPRTLSMALEGLRDFSLITTAPSRRLAVKTFVKPFSEGSVREAVLRELKRGGQVFFLHNEVDTIENMRERLETLLPEARIGVAHGQLRERELEQVMRDFLQQRFNVLLCSTIIETGIDIPNANTIIINRADKFGIAQLHQLRGRVGRSHHQAYAYLLTPEYISKDAEKRLDAIAAADELGAGFSLAMQDLEIRGAGEILGEGQSGEMVQVGFTLYTEMLKQAVRDLKKGRQPDLDAPLGVTTEIKLHSPALLPEGYCPDIHERLVLYKRLATCENEGQINSIHEELVDRFGLPEQPVKTLLDSHRLRLAAKSLGITAIDASSDALTLTFGKHTSVEPADIILLMQSNKNYRMAGADKLRVSAVMEDVDARVRTIRAVLGKLGGKAA